MKLSYTKMFAVWFTVGTALAFILFASALIPGFNIGAVPTFIVISCFIHLIMYFWISWTYILEPEKPKQNYEDDFEKNDPWY
tara:strand:+ start:178 stop:423 length:246 start_codon:yes stop_codon:yes gene_type:complete